MGLLQDIALLRLGCSCVFFLQGVPGFCLMVVHSFCILFDFWNVIFD